MNLLHTSLVFLFGCSSLTATGQQPSPKPPVGVPADAKHFNGKWYRVFVENKRVTWQAAKQRCEAMGGQLAAAPDKATWDYVRNLIAEATKGAAFHDPGVWLGGTRDDTKGHWHWLDGSPFQFTAWNRGKPDNATTKDYYLAVHGGGWDDYSENGYWSKANQITGFVCAWKAK